MPCSLFFLRATAQEQCCELSYQSQLLHAGYNMKADQGPLRCLGKHRLSQSELHVVHFSGREKPSVMILSRSWAGDRSREGVERVRFPSLRAPLFMTFRL